MSDGSHFSLALAPGAVVGGDYRIVRPLNEGGMGAVYVAEQLSTRKQRALKVMHPRLVPDARSRERFREEASVGSRIPSEHVVEVIAAGVDEPTGMPWLAMELLDGTDLDRVVREQAPLSPAVVAEIFTQMGHALRAAHAQGIVHRDLKPENLFAARARRSDARMTVKVLDFGIAKTIAEAKTAATVTTAIGSPLWMAPEQGTAGAELRPSTDVWALGLIAFHLLTERFYWPSANLTPVALQPLLVDVMVRPLVPASVRAAELGRGDRIPPGFDAWFAGCVHRDPSQRYAEAGAAVDALRAILLGAPSVQDGRTVPIGQGTLVVSSPATVVIAPPARSRPGLWVGLGAGAVVVVASALALVITLQGSGTDASPALAGSLPPAPPPSPAHGAPASGAPAPGAPAPAEPAAATEAAPPTAVAGQRELADDPAPAQEVVAAEPVAAASWQTEPHAGPAEPIARAGSDSSTRPRSVQSIGSVFGGGGGGGSGGGGTTAPRASASYLPQVPSRSDVVAAMNSVSGGVSSCGGDQSGLASVQVVFRSSGRVANAQVSGMFAGTPVGACVARAVRGARVPPFQQATYAVNYPFQLRGPGRSPSVGTVF